MNNLTCVTCGGTEFDKEAGFFFCRECQTQAAGIQEQEFEQAQADETIIVPKTTTKKLSSSSKTPKPDQITSWECYNYILLGLVNELIELGAHENLKPIVQTIWFKYLKKIEVIHDNITKPPNLPAYNNKHDARVIFGRTEKKKVYKRKRGTSVSSALSVSDSESTISIREQNRLKRAMVKAVYESQQLQSTQQSDASLLNQSLGSLKSNTSGQHKDNYLNFSKSAKIELRSHMTTSHLKEHIEDVDVALNCHNLSYKDVSNTYRRSPNIMNQTKLYSILYLGLLINKDDIHLGDMIRYMNEGSLSYNYYQHFFPEDVEAQTTFLHCFRVSKVSKYETYRADASKIIQFLDLADDLPTPNIVKLITRYCKELNLPREICEVCLNFLAQKHPQMRFVNNELPNYEAKAMCVIMFVLKLLFGLDNVTELHLSSFADKINDADFQKDDPEMFEFMDWLSTILYRRQVLAKHHFPTGFLEKKYCTQDYIGFLNAYYRKYDIQRLEDIDYDHIDKAVFKNIDFEGETLSFNPSLTPLFDNMKVLFDSGKLKNYQLDVLLRNYEFASVRHLREPRKYFTDDTQIVGRGANSNVKLISIYNSYRPYAKGKTSLTCKLSDDLQGIPKVLGDDDDLDTQNHIDVFDHVSADKFNESRNKSFNEFGLSVKDYTKHYRPDMRYWLRLGVNIRNMTTEEFDKFWEDFPYHFRLIVAECASITSQCVKDIMWEFNYFESFVCYEHLFDDSSNKKKGKKRGKNSHLNVTLMRLVKTAKEHW